MPPLNEHPTAERWETPDGYQVERWGDGSVWVTTPDGALRMTVTALVDLLTRRVVAARCGLVRVPLDTWNAYMRDLGNLYQATADAHIYPRGDVAGLVCYHIEKNRVPEPDESVDLTGITWGEGVTSSMAGLARALGDGTRWTLVCVDCEPLWHSHFPTEAGATSYRDQHVEHSGHARWIIAAPLAGLGT